MIKSGREVIVHCPATVCNEIVKSSLGLNVVLSYDVFAFIATAFSFTGQKADPVKLPVIKAVIASVFEVIPDSEGYFQQLMFYFFRIVYAVLFSAKLNPPPV